jgi:hypothetical protein
MAKQLQVKIFHGWKVTYSYVPSPDIKEGHLTFSTALDKNGTKIYPIKVEKYDEQDPTIAITGEVS